MSPLPESRVNPDKKTDSKILLLLGVCGRCIAAVDFILQSFPVLTKCRFFISKAVVIDDTSVVNYTEYASVDVLPFEEKT